MKEENLLRLSIIVKAGQASTFNSNLIKLVYMTLYDSEHYSLSIDKLRENIEKNYELEFTNEEIEEVVKSKDCGVLCIKEEKNITSDLGTYTEKNIVYKLDEKTIQKFKNNEEQNPFKNIISDFIAEFSINEHTHEEVEDILNRFLYNIFNSNKKTLFLLLKNEKVPLLKEVELFEIKENEKRIINDFLNWDNTLKNQFIYNAVSYCVDYCMLTIKKDYSSFSQLFRGKIFYLDANVIFRMAGFNNEERRTVTNSFIKKCTDNGIEIRYTNFTYEEIRETIKNQVEGLKNISRGHRLVATTHYRNFSKPSANLDFIQRYDKWCKKAGTQYNDFEGFRKFMLKTIDDILKGFKRVDFISYETTDKKTFPSLAESLKEYKTSRKANWSNSSIGIDVNNYLYIFELRKKSKGANFVDISDYLISTDGNLCEWGKGILPSVIPIAVLPSVWHSLLLKFKGRTNEDYKAFTLFLNLRYRVTNNGFDERRPQILALVQSLDEPVDIKNLILEEIADNITTKYNEIIEVPEIVEKAKNEVIERETNKIYELEGKPLIDQGKAAGRLEAFYEIAEKKAEKTINRRNKIFKFVNWFKLLIGIVIALSIIAAVIIFGIGIISKIFKKELFGYDIFNWTTVLGFLSCIIVFFIINPIKSLFEKLDFEKLKDKEFKRLTSSKK